MSDHETWELREAVRDIRAELDELRDRTLGVLEDLAKRMEKLEAGR